MIDCPEPPRTAIWATIKSPGAAAGTFTVTLDPVLDVLPVLTERSKIVAGVGVGVGLGVVRDDTSVALLRLMLAGIVVLAIACAVLDPFGDIKRAVLALAGAAFLIWSVVYTSRHHEWLIFALFMVEVLASSSILPDNVGTVGRYGLEALFCLPVVPAFLRSGIWRKGGFRLFFLYIAWDLVTVSYSIAPLFSLGRVLNTTLLVAAVSFCACEITTPQDLNRLLRGALLACVIILGLLYVAALVLPASLTWGSDDIVNESSRVVFSRGGMLRFQGFLGLRTRLARSC